VHFGVRTPLATTFSRLDPGYTFAGQWDVKTLLMQSSEAATNEAIDTKFLQNIVFEYKPEILRLLAQPGHFF